MKILRSQKAKVQGSILVVALFVTAFLGVSLGAYLLMVQNQNASVSRSQVWNASIAATEAGIEDALTMLNYATNWSSTAFANGWSSYTSGVYTITRTVGNDPNVFYTVTISDASSTSPIITSTGHSPFQYASGSSLQPFYAAAGVTQPTEQPASLRRTVRVRTKLDALFSLAMAADQEINMNGNTVATDSFDSADSNYSTGGKYDPTKEKDAGDVASNGTIVNIGNANIKGSVKTGPNGTISFGPSSSVGDSAWVDGGNKGIQIGHSANDMNVDFPDVVLPSVPWVPASPMAGTINGKFYTHIFNTSGNYVLSTLTGSVYIKTNANVVLKISQNVKLTGSTDEIRLAENATLKIYMAGNDFSIKGNGLVNDSGNAANFTYYGLPSNTGVTFGGNAAFTGTIYAPSAHFALGGGGSDVYDFVGASITRSVKMNGHFKFHYDENLRRVGPNRGYIPTEWREVKNN